MSFFRSRKLFIVVLVLFLAFIVLPYAQGQLIIIRKRLKVVKVEPGKDHIEVTGVDDPMRTLGYVKVDGNTRVTKDGRPFDWRRIQPGWIIGVKGGMTFTFHINANEIEVLRTY